MPAFHRIYEKTSNEMFELYSKQIMNSQSVQCARKVIKYAENCSKLKKEDLDRLYLLSITRQQELEGGKIEFQ